MALGYPNSITDAKNAAKLDPPVVEGKHRNEPSSQQAGVTLPNRGQSSTPYPGFRCVGHCKIGTIPNVGSVSFAVGP